jgi:general secretion pathway protein A
MRSSHDGPEELPFHTRLDPRFFYQGPAHEEALARLHFLVEQRRRVGLLVGLQGSGKSLLLEVFAGRIRDSGRPVGRVNLLGLEPAEFLWQLAAELGLNPQRGRSLPALWRAVIDRLVEFRYQRWETVVLLDDADRASEEVLTQAARLARLDLGRDAWLTIVLAGRQEGVARLGAALLDLVELRIDLGAWEPDDTKKYLEHCLSQIGRPAPVFAEPAVRRLHELGRGIPRRITQLAELALLAGAGQELHQIDTETVELVYQELAGVGG